MKLHESNVWSAKILPIYKKVNINLASTLLTKLKNLLINYVVDSFFSSLPFRIKLILQLLEFVDKLKLNKFILMTYRTSL